MGAAAWHPAPLLLPARLGDTPCPPRGLPQSLGTANSRWTLSALSSCGMLLSFGVWMWESCAVALLHPCQTPHPDRHQEHLAAGGMPFPTVSTAAAEQRCSFVLISFSKPRKWKFPHGKPLIFECARMCWNPSQWKIPNQLHSALTSLEKPLSWEHT